jgi:hypothetical protein
MRKLTDILKKALEMGKSLHKGPLWGTWGDVPFLRAFQRRVKFLLSENLYEGINRHVKEGYGNGQISP